MPDYIKLSELVEQIQGTIQNRFEGEAFWVSARAMNIRDQRIYRRCFLTLEEYENGNRQTTKIEAVFWPNSYDEIENFEKLIKQPFSDSNGIEIICKVKV